MPSVSPPSSLAARPMASELRPMMTTRAPWFLSSFAVAKPMPLLPPVITAILFWSFIYQFSFLVDFFGRLLLLWPRGPDGAGEKLSDKPCDERAVLFQREMAGIEQMEICLWEIPQVSPRPGFREERIVPAPGDQRWGLVPPEIILPHRVLRRVVLVIMEQGELD